MNRRGFLGGLLAAPAIVRAESLMKIWVPPKEVIMFRGGVSDLRFSRHAAYFPRYLGEHGGPFVNFPISALTIGYE